MATWFTADLHLGHANIIKYCDRPFKDVNEMDSTLISYWNTIIQPNDTVFHIGDFTLGNINVVIDYLARLKGNIVFLRGSHDYWMGDYIERYGEDIFSRHDIVKDSILEVEINHQKIVMCHYAMRSWPASFHGSWQLYGHSHGRLESNRQPRQMDVGVDCHNFMPWSYEQIYSVLSKDRERALD